MRLVFGCDILYIYALILFVTLFIMYLLVGGKKHAFVGLDENNKVTVCTKTVKVLHKETHKNVGKIKRKYIKCSKGETECRNVLEDLFNVYFDRCRPDFLKNPETKRNLELDCFNGKLMLAVEYNGVQHYVHPNFTNQSKEAFVKQMRRDIFKIEMCDKLHIYLITVPYTVKRKDIKEYIISRIPRPILSKRKDI
ncbi:MAG: hypothetical protein COA94_08385 [Rickettsiales bacterium]|nr:MAG: hypothetical protein COA94_08385 [Rickettsiales bacterium]